MRGVADVPRLGTVEVSGTFSAVATIQSVERAFTVLRCLAGGPAGLADVAERARLPKSTVSRMLSTLVHVGAVEIVGGGTYRIGAVVSELGAGTLPGANVVAVARPGLGELVSALGEDAGLAVLDGGDAYYLDQVSADSVVMLHDWTGERVAAHAVPSGLVLLAALDSGERDARLSGRLERFTGRTVTSPTAVRRRLDAIAAGDPDVTTDGAVWVYGEFSSEINSVAAPIRNGAGDVVAALHVHGPSYRFPGSDDPSAIAHVVAAAGRRVSNQLAAGALAVAR